MFINGNTSPGMSVLGVVDAATYQAAVSPGMLVSIFGAQLAGASGQAKATPLPFSLGGVSARVNGVDAPVEYVSSGQLNIQIPYEAGAGTAVLGVNNGGQLAAFQFPDSAGGSGYFRGCK